MGKVKPYKRDSRSPVPINETRSKIMRSIRGKNTKPELILRKTLWNKGLRGYRLHWKKVPGRPDIVFVSKKVAIFVNGCFWHRCPSCSPPDPKHNASYWKEKLDKNVERDKNKRSQLKNLNWEVITVWECEIKKNVENVVNKIENALHNSNTD